MANKAMNEIDESKRSMKINLEMNSEI